MYPNPIREFCFRNPMTVTTVFLLICKLFNSVFILGKIRLTTYFLILIEFCLFSLTLRFCNCTNKEGITKASTNLLKKVSTVYHAFFLPFVLPLRSLNVSDFYGQMRM